MIDNKETLFDLSDTGLSDDVLFEQVSQDSSSVEKIVAPRYSYWSSVFRVFFSKRSNIVILVLFALVLGFTYIYPTVGGFDRYENLMDSASRHLTPSAAIAKFGFQLKYIFGTGDGGRSTFDAIWYGARISISMAVLVAAINYTIGVVLGALWGFSKKVDIVMNEIRNIVANVPGTLVTSVLVMIFAPNFWTLIFAMCVTGWIGVSYSIRTQVIIIRDRDYNLASKCLGSSTVHIATHNILPFMISFIVTLLSTSIPMYIGSEAFLSYIGLGISDMTLGKLLNSSAGSMTVPGWEWEFWCPVMLSSFISIVLFLIGQSLADATDPRTHML